MTARMSSRTLRRSTALARLASLWGGALLAVAMVVTGIGPAEAGRKDRIAAGVAVGIIGAAILSHGHRRSYRRSYRHRGHRYRVRRHHRVRRYHRARRYHRVRRHHRARRFHRTLRRHVRPRIRYHRPRVRYHRPRVRIHRPRYRSFRKRRIVRGRVIRHRGYRYRRYR